MCGIAGFVGRKDKDKACGRALDVLAHRGPDASGLVSLPFGRKTLHLGHRRLSIIDLSEAANQPFRKDGFVLVFNGEIYNYRELREELQGHGAQFTTQSDTEVVLEAWRYWGKDSFGKLRGMFALALYDPGRDALILARDPFGIKPLYVWQGDKGELGFASELKGLKALVGEDWTISRTAMISSLLYCWLPHPHCIYEEAEKLSPGHWLEYPAEGKAKVQPYWRPSTLMQPRDPVTVESLRAVIEASVEAHMVADVPVSTFLSGGLDSSILTVLAKRYAGELDSYTIAFRSEDQQFEAMPDDERYATQLAEKEGIRLHRIEVQPDIADMLPRMVEVLDEPIGDSAAINTLLICEAARDAGVKVLLSGMGADELFGGYRRHMGALVAQRYRAAVPGFMRSMIRGLVNQLPVAGASKGYRSVRWAKRFLSFADMEEEAAYMRSYNYYGEQELQALVGDAYADPYAQLCAEHTALYRSGPPLDSVNRMCWTDMHYFMEGLNQTYSDRASMAASTEIRVPFIDREVARCAFATRGNQKIQGRQQKALLKQAAEAWLPKEIIYRPKASFGTPLRAWVRHDLAEMIDDLLPGGQLVGDGYVQAAEVTRLIADDRQGKADYAQQIWQLLTLEQWLRGEKG